MKARDFDKDARSWDDNLARVKLAQDIFAVMNRQICFIKDMNILDFGCGTGLLTLGVAPLVAQVTGADSSREMIKVLLEKAAGQNKNNVNAVSWDAKYLDDLPGQYNGIISSMALHHVENTRGLLKVFYKHVVPGGFIALADLDFDDGDFHQDKTGVFHNGFSREWLSNEIAFAGFIPVSAITAAYIDKPFGEKIRRFSIFLITAKKPA